MFTLYATASIWLTSNSIPYNLHTLFTYVKTKGQYAFTAPDGWVFYRPSLSSILLPWRYTPQNKTIIHSLNDSLKSLGINLLVIPVPDKENIIQTYSLFRTGNASNQRIRLIKSLAANGVNVIDLNSEFIKNRNKEQLYRKDDTHWDQDGIRLCAKVISRKLNIPDDLERKYHLKDTIISEQGDLSLMMRDSIPKSRTCSMIVDENERPFTESRKSKIIIFGDSFTNANRKHSAGLGAYITFLSNNPTATVFSLKANIDGPRLLLKYLNTTKDHPKIIIWVFTSRSLFEKIKPF